MSFTLKQDVSTPSNILLLHSFQVIQNRYQEINFQIDVCLAPMKTLGQLSTLSLTDLGKT